MILEYNSSERSITRTMLHEAIGHRGVINIFPNAGKSFLTDVYDSMSNEDKIKYISKNKSKARAVNEYVADLAGSLIESPTKWQTLCAKFRNHLRNMRVNIRLNDNDIRFILRDIRDTSATNGITPTYNKWN